MFSGQLRDCALLAAVVATTRLAFQSHLLYDLDSVNFALALEKFDPALLQPHPPGYYLYVVAGRILYAFFGDPNAAFVSLSVAASCGMGVTLYALAKSWYGTQAARCAALIFVVSPLCWFHGTVALTYIVEGFFATLLGYLCWQVYAGRSQSLVPSAVVLSLAVGFRQSSILFLGPLLALGYWKATRRQIRWGAAAFCLTTFCWFFPMVVESGGLIRYLTALYGMWSSVPGQQTVFNQPFVEAISLALSRGALIGFIAILCFGPFVFMPLLTRLGHSPVRLGRYACLWLLPGLLFFTFVYLIFVNSGYLIILSPPVFAWLGSKTEAWFRSPPTGGWTKGGVVAACAALNVILFLWGPWYCSYRSVRALEADLASMQQAVRARFLPRETLLLSFDSHFMGFRHVGYYLPEFMTIVYPEAQLPDGKVALSMRRGQTQLLTRAPNGPTQFAMVPLPQGERYDRYLAKVIALFPPRVLRPITFGDHRFHVGALSDLRYALPTTLSGQEWCIHE